MEYETTYELEISPEGVNKVYIVTCHISEILSHSPKVAGMQNLKNLTLLIK